MSIYSANDPSAQAQLRGHLGHRLRISDYGDGASTTMECVRCSEVLIDFSPDYEDEAAASSQDVQQERNNACFCGAPGTDGLCAKHREELRGQSNAGAVTAP